MGRSVTVPDLRDDVIALRLPAQRDVDAITAACQDPDIPRFTRIKSPYTRADAVSFVELAVEHWRDCEPSRADRTTATPGLSFAIADGSTDQLLGCIGVHPREQAEVAEIGYWVVRDARRRGIATRAVKLASPWAFRELDLQRLELLTRTDNVASQGVAERAGFTREGLLRSYITLGDRLTDVHMFSLLPRDLAECAGT
jgi:RimJ/RimL family protein N-acetyltransferase